MILFLLFLLLYNKIKDVDQTMPLLNNHSNYDSP